MEIDIKFNNNTFNPLFFKLREVEKSGKRFIISRGGAGSSKSYSMSQYLIVKALEQKERILIVRKYSNTLKDSVVALLNDIISSWNLSDQVVYNKTEGRLTFKNGSEILTKGMDDPEKIKSVANITLIWCEEATELDKADFDQLNLRLRGKKNLQLHLSFNPVNKENWIYKTFFDSHTLKNNTHYFKTTYKHNRFIDYEYKQNLENLKDYDYNQYKIYALGEWGSLSTGNEFYKSFKDVLIGDFPYDPELPLYVSFDENVIPYSTALLFQLPNEKTIYFIDEVTLADPFNTLKDVCDTIIKIYPDHEQGMIITGDATSKKRDSKIEQGSNFFYLALGYLDVYHPTLNVPASNPGVILRGSFINQIFAFGLSDIKLFFNNKCVKLINDFSEVKENGEGKKHKRKVRDKKTGLSYEPFGHLSDSFDYAVCNILNKEWDLFKSGGRKVNIKVPQFISTKRW